MVSQRLVFLFRLVPRLQRFVFDFFLLVIFSQSMVFLFRLVPRSQRFIRGFFVWCFTIVTGRIVEGEKDCVLKLVNDFSVGKIVVLLFIYVDGDESILIGLGNLCIGAGNRAGGGNSLLPLLLYIFLSGA